MFVVLGVLVFTFRPETCCVIAVTGDLDGGSCDWGIGLLGGSCEEGICPNRIEGDELLDEFDE